MSNDKIDSENPAQDTQGIHSEKYKILNQIIDNLQEVDFIQYIESEKKKAKSTEVEEVVSESDNEDTLEPTEVTSDTVMSSNSLLKITQNGYKIYAIKALVDKAEELGYPIADFNRSIQVYTGKRWMKVEDEEAQVFLMKALEKLGVPKLICGDVEFVKRSLKQLNLESHINVKEMKSMDLINFDNVTLHLNGEEFKSRDHNPKDYLSYVLPYEYNPKATCPKFQKFLDRVIPEKDKQLILAEFFGSVFSKIKHEKVLILYGIGANGKSVVLLVITSVLGEVNVSSSTLESLTDSSGYYRGILADSLLNYSGEISKKINSDQFKKLASREKTECRYPSGKPFTISNYARLAFNCNELPDSEDTTEGFYRRFLIVHFDKFIPPKERDRNLANDIIKDELPGIMNWLLEGLVRLNKQQDFSKCKSADQMLDWYRVNTNTIVSFKESELFKKIVKPTRATELYAEYTKHCKDEGLKPLGQKSFLSSLKNYGFHNFRKAGGSYYDLNATSSAG